MQFIFTCFVSDETGFDECGFILRGDIVAREDTQKSPAAHAIMQKIRPKNISHGLCAIPLKGSQSILNILLTSNYTEISFYQLDKFKFV